MKKSILVCCSLLVFLCLATGHLLRLNAQETSEKKIDIPTPSHFVGNLTVNPRIGALELSFSWLKSSQFGPELSLTYHAGREGVGFFGPGWWSSAENSLQIFPSEGKILWLQANQDPIEFLGSNESGFISTTGEMLKIEKKENQYLLQQKHFTYLFSSQGQIQKITSPQGLSLEFTYNNSQILQMDCSGHTIRFTSKDNRIQEAQDYAGRKVKFHYTPEGNLAAVEDSEGRNVLFQYDELKRISEINQGAIQIAYNDLNQVVSIKGTALPSRDYKYSYNENEKVYVTEVEDSLGHSTRYQYSQDELNVKITEPSMDEYVYYLNSRRLPETVITPPFQIRRFQYDQKANLVQYTDPSKKVFQMEYNQNNDLTSIKGPDGSMYKMEYNEQKNLSALVHPDGRKISFDYDPKGLLKKVSRPDGTEMSYQYDHYGNVALRKDNQGLEEKFVYDSLGRFSSMERGDFKVQYTYSSHGREMEIVNQKGEKLQISLGLLGEIEKYVDAQGNTTRYRYNPQGLMKSLSYSNGAFSEFSYDSEGHLSGLTDPSGRNFSFQYSSTHQPVAWKNSAGNQTRYEYNEFGGKKSKILPGGKKIFYGYDKLGRLVQIQSAEDTSTFEYDEQGNLSAMKNKDSSFQFFYDSHRKLVRIYDKILGKSVRYSYNARGLRSSMETPFGAVNYLYDSTGRLKKIVDFKGKSFQREYNSKGLQSKIIYPNGIFSQYTYDASDRLVHLKTMDVSGTLLLERKYAYDALGRRVSVVDEKGKESSYQYDKMGRLKKALEKGKETRYGYDNVGNRLYARSSHQKVNYSYDANGRLVTENKTRYEYDEQGCLKAKISPEGRTYYTYDSNQKLRQVRLPSGQVVEYGYAPNGARIWKKINGKTTRYLYDMENVIGEYSENSLELSYIHGQGIDEPLAQYGSEKSRYYHSDGLSSISLLTDASGEVSGKYSYNPYGELAEKKGNTSGNPYLFTGRRFDEETGLYYNRARYYDPQTGRFISPDPMLFVDGTNMYAYCFNDPINLVDPFGTWGWWNDLKNKARSVTSSVSSAVSKAASWTADTAVAIGRGARDAAGGALLVAGIGPEEEVNAARKGFYDGLANNYVAGQVVNFGIGFGNGIYSGAKSLVEAVVHPIKTLTEIKNAVVHYDETWDALHHLWNEYMDAASSDPQKFARMTGHLTGEIIFAILGTKGVDKLGKAKVLSKMRNLAKGRMAALSENLAHSSKVRKLNNALKTVYTGAKLTGKQQKKLRQLMRKIADADNARTLRRLEKQAANALGHSINNGEELLEKLMKSKKFGEVLKDMDEASKIAMGLALARKTATVLNDIREAMELKLPASVLKNLEKAQEVVLETSHKAFDPLNMSAHAKKEVEEKKHHAANEKAHENHGMEDKDHKHIENLARNLKEAENALKDARSYKGPGMLDKLGDTLKKNP